MSTPAPKRRILRNAAITQIECIRCGACCCNPPSNAAEGFFHWVEIGDDEPILAEGPGGAMEQGPGEGKKKQKQKQRLRQKQRENHNQGPDTARLVIRDDVGVAHLRLDPEGRCLALRGRLGRRVHCTVYKIRPRACRLVEAGGDECMQARASRGID